MAQSRKTQRRSRNRSRKQQQRGGMADYPGAFQTKAELAQFGSLPGNTWASGLGRDPAINDQMEADTGGYYVVSGGRQQRRSRKSRKQRRS